MGLPPRLIPGPLMSGSFHLIAAVIALLALVFPRGRFREARTGVRPPYPLPSPLKRPA